MHTPRAVFSARRVIKACRGGISLAAGPLGTLPTLGDPESARGVQTTLAGTSEHILSWQVPHPGGGRKNHKSAVKCWSCSSGAGLGHGPAVTALGAGEEQRRSWVKNKSPASPALQGGDTGQQQVTVLGTEVCEERGQGQNSPCALPASPPSLLSLWLRQGHRENTAALLCLISVWQHFSSRAASQL